MTTTTIAPPQSTHDAGGPPGRGTTKGKRNLAAAMAHWSARHRAWAIVGWLVFVLAAAGLSNVLGTVEAEGDGGNTESGRASQIVDAAGFPDLVGEMVLVSSDTLTADAQGFQAAIREVTTAIAGTGNAVNVKSPLDPDGANLVSEDRKAALVTFDIPGEDTADEKVGPILDAVARVQAAHPDLYVAEAGGASADRIINGQMDEDLNRLGLLSLPLTLGILLVAFGAILAAFLPLLLAVTAFLASLGLVALASRAIPIVDSTSHLMLLIGLAVGVDYCLFYLRREREERAKGADPERALSIAAATSGRSVLISGFTVIIAMAGMFLTREETFSSFAVGTILVVATAVLGSLTVLPALLSALGDRVDLGRIPGLYRREPKSRLWTAVLTAVLKRPAVSALLGVAALAALAAPALGMKTGNPGIEDFNGDIPVIETFRRIDAAFPGGDDPARVVVKAPDVTASTVEAAITEFRQRALASGAAHEPVSVEVNPDRTVAVISVGLSGGGNDDVAQDAVRTLRSDVIPATLGRVGGAEVGVTGAAAGNMDFTESMRTVAPLVFVFVLGLAFILLLVSFRSVVVAVTAIVLNLLSVAAAYGLLVLVFQHGWGEDLLGFTSTGTITDWLPLFLFVILFGLSMDYHVFVLSRIREEYDRGLSTKDAVARGIAGTAGVITSAAVVMVAVFGLFGTMSLTSMKQMGLGLAVAVLLDATVIRAVLLPAVMALLGDRNWYLPRWLRWLPKASAH